jgi:hypothetical protein
LTIEDRLGSGFHPRVLLGTLPLTPVSDITYLAIERDFAVLFLDAAFIDFVYQVTKVTVRSWKLTTPADRLPAGFSARREDVAATLAADPSLAQGFFRCIETYVRTGLPGRSSEGAPPAAFQAPLSLLTTMAERLMVARGYAQLALEDPEFPGGVPIEAATAARRERTLGRDFVATIHVLTSSALMDRTHPAMALQGCGMPLICADLIQRAVSLIDPTTPRWDSEMPTLERRLGALEDAYLEFVTRQAMDPALARDGLTPAHWAWQTPEMLWEEVRPLLVKAGEQGLRPASVWTTPAASTALAALLTRPVSAATVTARHN